MARLKEYEREREYQNYMTDSIYYYAHNQAFQMRFADMIDPVKVAERNKSGDEIVADVVNNAGLILR